jgi:hypothetical protein
MKQLKSLVLNQLVTIVDRCQWWYSFLQVTGRIVSLGLINNVQPKLVIVQGIYILFVCIVYTQRQVRIRQVTLMFISGHKLLTLTLTWWPCGCTSAESHWWLPRTYTGRSTLSAAPSCRGSSLSSGSGTRVGYASAGPSCCKPTSLQLSVLLEI